MTQKIENKNLTIEISESSDEVIYTLTGNIDEYFKQEEVPRINKKKIIFQLEGLDNFNSCGIREWIYLIDDISKLGNLEFHKCSITMIDQINMVPDTAKNVTVKSFFAPYYCENKSCSGEVNCLIDVEKERSSLENRIAPDFDCETCNEKLDFDALEESYFIFLNSGKSFPAAS